MNIKYKFIRKDHGLLTFVLPLNAFLSFSFKEDVGAA